MDDVSTKLTRPSGPSGPSGLDDERQYQAAISKDARFDGVFFIGVSSTGIYCRPSCPAITPKREHMRYYRTAAAAQEAGFRACKRCRPDASPGSPEWNIRADVVGRAMRLIADGAVDRDGVAGLASRLGYEQRQVRRLITAELGAGPLAIARAQRAQTARVLTETTALPLSEIAFAAGFTSIRQFNATILEVFAVTPTQLREARGRRGQVPRARRITLGPASGRADPAAPGMIRLRLPYRPPIDMDRMIGFLAARAIPGVEAVADGRYRRTMLLPNGMGILSVGSGTLGYVDCELQLDAASRSWLVGPGSRPTDTFVCIKIPTAESGVAFTATRSPGPGWARASKRRPGRAGRRPAAGAASPWPLTGSETRFMTAALQQAHDVASRFRDNP